MSWRAELRSFASVEAAPLLEALVAAPSVNPPGQEDLAARPLAAFLDRHDVPVQWQETEPGRPNVLASVEGARPGRSLVLCSHLDVVPSGDPELWTGDPFAPRHDEGRMYGRGTCDAKGALAAMAVVVAFCRRRGLERGRIELAAVCGEERGGTGAKFLVRSGFRADGAIIGEPTGLRVHIAHKGRLQADITILGQGGHASQPSAASNPIPRLAVVLERLESLAARVAERRHTLVGQASLVPTQVSSGKTNAATIPPAVTVTLDRRLLPGETHAEAAAEIEAAVAHLPDVRVTWVEGAHPHEVDPQSRIVTACLEAAAELVGEPGPTGFPATSDQYILGRAGIPAAIVGPGEIGANRAHAPDEFLELEDLARAAVLYGVAADAFLRV